MHFDGFSFEGVAIVCDDGVFEEIEGEGTDEVVGIVGSFLGEKVGFEMGDPLSDEGKEGLRGVGAGRGTAALGGE